MTKAMMQKVFERLNEKKPGLKYKDAIYCCEPLNALMNDYMEVVDKTIDESDSLARMIDSKDLDIAQMKKQNEKFLAEFGEKTSWQTYE